MTNDTLTAVEAVERAFALADTEGYTPEIEQVFEDYLPEVLALAKQARPED